MAGSFDIEKFGPLLHGTARAWRLKLDQRLKPLGMSQARWRTLLHLSLEPRPITQSEIAARLGIEEPTLVNLLHRLEETGWVSRKNAANDRRCKTVHLGKRAHRTIARINREAVSLRDELLSEISQPELKICMRVLARIRDRAETTGAHSKRKVRRASMKHGVGANGKPAFGRKNGAANSK